MPKKHFIKFILEVEADEMDGTPYESALILLELLDKTIGETISDIYSLSVVDYDEVED